ncbi:glycosyltransferase [Pleurocapsa sp. PCC 7319]|uniref:glycosyltransferase n=1 Tax=Pleurocapsa sp. PCC 7319 TaxID=118161 RepID=UPI0003455109|nr:glycosyltransferase [Pleurocapsa sp. PCC 7319]
MKIAYLISQYPKVSHSFIRREIAALEAEGIQVVRYAIRSCAAELVDEADKRELEKTRFILEAGVINLLVNLILVAITRPIRFLATLWLTMKIGWGQDRGLLIHLAYLAEACVLLGWVKASAISHIHAHFAFNPTTVAMLCHELGGPTYSFTVHGPEEIDRAIILSLAEKIKRATFVAAISSYCKSQLYRWCDRAYWSKIHVVHCGLDELFLKHQLTPIPDNSQLVCVGRLNEQKGQLILLEAASQLAREGLEFKLTFVGDGDFRPQVEHAIAELELENQVEITGWVTNSQVSQYILNSRAMVLASFAEGLPVVMMEALALGRPVIGTYIAGIPELIEHESCGWLVSAGSVEDLASTMRTVLRLPVNELEHMSQQGREKIIQQHNISVEAKKLIALFRESKSKTSSQIVNLDNRLLKEVHPSTIQ